jgi:hypothetical protein
MNLAGEIPEGRREYLSPAEALDMLKRVSGQDYGYDLKAWKQWLKENPPRTWQAALKRRAAEAANDAKAED